jgi:hypothetical protein
MKTRGPGFHNTKEMDSFTQSIHEQHNWFSYFLLPTKG